MNFSEDYEVALARGEDTSFATYFLCNDFRDRFFGERLKFAKHRKVTKIDRKKIKNKRRMSKRSRKYNR